MKVKESKIPVAELVDGYVTDRTGRGKAPAMGGKMRIKPPFNYRFVYKEDERDSVIKTIFHGFPLTKLHFSVEDDGLYEIVDGQQKVISICDFVDNNFSVDLDGRGNKIFANLSDDEQKRILDYQLDVNLYEDCDAGDKLQMLHDLNSQNEKISSQEMRNIVYQGPMTHRAQSWFCKPGSMASAVGKGYVDGRLNRQEYFEAAISWLVGKDKIETWMQENQNNPEAADELSTHFQNVIQWVKATFPYYRPEMKKVDWGELYREHGDDPVDPAELSADVARLFDDDSIEKKYKPLIFAAVLRGEEYWLRPANIQDNIEIE